MSNASETTIELYSCNGCGAIRDQFEANDEVPCKCSGRMFTELDPTLWAMFRYFLARPSKLLLAIKEGLTVKPPPPDIVLPPSAPAEVVEAVASSKKKRKAAKRRARPCR